MYLTLGKARGVIDASPSKSHLVRLLFLSYMSEGESVITLPANEICSDVTDALNCAAVFGKKCVFENKTIKVTSGERKDSVSVEGSAASLRFLLACGSAKGESFAVKCGEKLRERPHAGLIDALGAHGAEISVTKDGFTVNGKLNCGDFCVSAEKTSQYVSSLCLALPFVTGDSRVTVDGKISSLPYLKMTLSLLCGVGSGIREENGVFEIDGGFVCDGVNAVCEGDWSSAAAFLCMGAVGGSVRVNGVSPSSLQGDKVICEILERSGENVVFDENGVTVEKGKGSPFDVDVTDIPDLAPILAAYAFFCNGTSVIRSVSRLRYKESDRVKAIADTISRFGGKASFDGENIYIEKGVFVPESSDCGNDHRVAFLLAILSAAGKIEINGGECAAKSCPSFFEKYKQIGGEIS